MNTKSSCQHSVRLVWHVIESGLTAHRENIYQRELMHGLWRLLAVIHKLWDETLMYSEVSDNSMHS